ncbi:hypothetical protein I4U23_013618 [Adineta vaga]|nr:hypothetical protein I4U23_013618 [Adineta vaga]
MSSRLSDFKSIFYDSKRHEFFGRDGNGWAKLAIVYSVYYFGLAAFFCAMITILMSITPQDVPRYSSTTSCMQSRSSPLSPGMGFRPQPNVLENLVYIDKNATKLGTDRYVKNLNQYLELYYGTENYATRSENYASDIDNIGDITYISENGHFEKCGSLDTKWFPYKGKKARQDVYQAPYVWVQFNNLNPNVLIHVVCRLYAENINFDRKSAGLTRFKLFLKG